jgi:hypothetical protein
MKQSNTCPVQPYASNSIEMIILYHPQISSICCVASSPLSPLLYFPSLHISSSPSSLFMSYTSASPYLSFSVPSFPSLFLHTTLNPPSSAPSPQVDVIRRVMTSVLDAHSSSSSDSLEDLAGLACTKELCSAFFVALAGSCSSYLVCQCGDCLEC